MLRIGIRAHDMGTYKIEEFSELCKFVKARGGKSIQLALNKSFTDIGPLKGKMTPGLGSFLKENLVAEGLEIAVLGSYINMANPDDEMMKKEIEKFREHLKFSKFIGNSIVGTETGCYNKEYKFTTQNETPEAFERFLSCLKTLVEISEKLGTMVAIEGVATHIVNTPKKMRKVLDLVNSDNLVVIFDPVNFLTEENYHLQDEIIRESFELFGDKIAIVHAKDYIIEEGKMKVVPATLGQFNYKLLIDTIKERKPKIDILLENSTPETAKQIIQTLQNI